MLRPARGRPSKSMLIMSKYLFEEHRIVCKPRDIWIERSAYPDYTILTEFNCSNGKAITSGFSIVGLSKNLKKIIIEKNEMYLDMTIDEIERKKIRYCA